MPGQRSVTKFLGYRHGAGGVTTVEPSDAGCVLTVELRVTVDEAAATVARANLAEHILGYLGRVKSCVEADARP